MVGYLGVSPELGEGAADRQTCLLETECERVVPVLLAPVKYVAILQKQLVNNPPFEGNRCKFCYYKCLSPAMTILRDLFSTPWARSSRLRSLKIR
jgi:hypothetical protein